jgi:hypothetical protein
MMAPNPGRCPPEAYGKRVIVKLANGRICGRNQVGPTSPIGWAAETTRWSITGHPFDIANYEVVG